MATSGSFTTTSYEGRSLTFSWNRTSYSVANNTSTIAWSVKGSGSYTGGWVTCGDIDVVVNGTTVYNSTAENRINIWSGDVVASGTMTITHDANGNKTFSASIKAAVYNYAQNVTGSGSFTLDNIPRAAGIDKIANTSGTTITTIGTGNSIRVYFTPKSTAFKYRVTVSMNGQSVQNNSAGISVTSTAQTYYQPAEIPHSWIPNATSGTLTCKLETLNGTTVIGTSTKTITMTVPTSIVPTISSLTSTPYNTNTVINGWGIYVTNYSKARLACAASGSNGSTIKKFTISNAASATINGTSMSYDAALSTGGSKTFTVVATDSRGRNSAAKSVTINVVNYYTPAIASFDVIRTDSSGNASDSGTAAKLSFSGSYTNIGNNAATAKFSYKLSTATTYTAISTTSAGSAGKINGGIVVSNVAFATASEYDFQMQITDSMGNTVSRTVRLGTVTRTMNIAKFGNGVAIGKMSTITAKETAGKFECGWDADFDKNVNIDGKLTLTGGLSAPLSIANGGTGANSAAGIASSHFHNSLRNISVGQGSTGYVKFATLKVVGTYANQCMEFKLARRQDTTSTTVYVNLSSSDSVDPGMGSVNYMGPAPIYYHKSATSTWDLYVPKTEAYDSIGILDFQRSDHSSSRITVTFPDTFVASLPSGYVTATRINADYIVENSIVNSWNVRKWSSGMVECWRNISTTPTVANGNNSVTVSLPFAFTGTDYLVQITPAKASMYVSAVGDSGTNGTITHTTTSFVLAYKYSFSTLYATSFNVYVYGRWK